MSDPQLQETLALCERFLRERRFAEVIGLCGQIVAQSPEIQEPYRLQALAYYFLGDLERAAQTLQQALAVGPSADCFDNLSFVLLARGQAVEAEAAARRALELEPGFVEALNNLGNALQAQARHAEAVDVYRQALAARPSLAAAAKNMGDALARLGRLDEAAAAFGQAIAARPDYVGAEIGLAAVLQRQGRAAEAAGLCRQTLQRDPNNALAHNCLGVALQSVRRYAEAEAEYREVLRVAPADAQAWSNLASVLIAQGRPADARAAARVAELRDPKLIDGYVNHASAACCLDALAEARRALEQAIALNPDSAAAHNGLGTALQLEGRIEEAEEHYRRALELDGSPVSLSNAIACRQYRPGVTRAELAEAHAEWDRRCAEPLRSEWGAWSVDRNPDRRLRLGFLSPNFAGHPVGHFLVGTLEALDRGRFQVYCYNDTLGPDSLTARIRASADVWRDALEQTDEELADQIRADRIDVLVDLAGHTESNRLMVLARKPAPLQVAWIGYPGTTGLAAIDYLIADEEQVPPGAEKFYRERPLRIRGGYVAYSPPTNAPPPAPLAPADAPLRFACFNNPTKINRDVVSAWAEILRRLPGARLLLKYGRFDDPAVQARQHAMFAEQGIEAERLEFLGQTDRADHMAAYAAVHVALDPWPYSGGVTTCEALWMGVPVVACPGETFAGRHSLSHLKAAGLEELVAADRAAYVELAVGLAGDRDRLAAYRRELRRRVADSPLCDCRRMAGELDRHLREAWRTWCDNLGEPR